MTAPVLITEDMAVEYTGRPATTIRRWAHEGRIHRHGKGRGQVRYNLWELHSKTVDDMTGEVTPGATPDMPTEPRGRIAA